MKRILLLAGTREARAIAAALKDDGRYQVIASFAGVTGSPANQGVETRTGGFGGTAGLGRFVLDRRIDMIVDATHPFAAQMKAHVAAQSVPTVHVIRPPWISESGDCWIACSGLDDAARQLPAESRAFLALGQRHLDAFRDHAARMWVRSVEPRAPLHSDRHDKVEGRFSWIIGSPGRVEDEVALFRQHGFTHIVCRNSGGNAGLGKIEAARRLGMPVLMVQRPAPPGGTILTSVDQVVEWCGNQGPD